MLKFLAVIILMSSQLLAGIDLYSEYRSPTSQLLKREKLSTIEKAVLELGIKQELFPYFHLIGKKETWGHLGYHGAEQGYRIYQDIIKEVVQNILEIPVKDDFHFLRVPADQELNLNTIDEFCDFWGNELDNRSNTRGKQLLSLNFSVWSNFDNPGSFSLGLFVNNLSKSDVPYQAALTPLFLKLGIDPNEISPLFEVGDRHLKGSGGILLQISENSHLVERTAEAYCFADTQAYSCIKKGFPSGRYPWSHHLMRIMSDDYVSKKIDPAPQFRLLINNRYTLNPFSYYTIRRYDLHPTKIIAAYKTELKEKIRKLSFNQEMRDSFRSELIRLWEIN